MMQACEEGRAPGAYRQQAAEEDDSINAEAAFFGPVVVGIEIEPENELIERERSAHAVADRHQSAEKNGKRRVRAAQIH